METMANSKVLISVEDGSLFNELVSFFRNAGFEVITAKFENSLSDEREIDFFVLDVKGATTFLQLVSLQKGHSDNLVPAIVFVSGNDEAVSWYQKGFDEIVFQTDSIELWKVKLQKWISLQQSYYSIIEGQKELVNIVVHNLNTPVVVLNEDGCVETINKVAVDLFGLDSKQIIGVYWAAVIPEEYHEQLIKIYEEAFKGDAVGVNQMELKIKDRLNRLRTWKVSIALNTRVKKFVVTMEDIEPAKGYQRAYYESEQKFLSAMEAVNEVFAVTTIGGIYVDVNSTFITRLGYRKEEVIGKNVLDLNIWSDPSDREHYVSELLSKGVVSNMKVVFKSKTGTLLYGILSGRIVMLNAEKYIFTSVKDSTELENIKTASRILQNIRKAIDTVADADSLLLTLSNEVNKFTCFQDAEFYFFKKSDSRVYCFDTQKVTPCKNHEADILLAGKTEKQNKLVVLSREDIHAELGDLIDKEQNSLPEVWVGIPLGAAHRFFGVIILKSVSRDLLHYQSTFSFIEIIACEISFFLEEKRVESEMVVIRHALNSAASAVVITDVDGNIDWVNKAFTNLTGYSSKEAIGKNPRILKSDKHPQSFYKKLWDTILAGKVWKHELINKRKDGSLYHEENTISPVFDSNGNITRFIAIKQDITKRIKFEEDLKDHLYRQQVLNDILSYYVSTDAIDQPTLITHYLDKIGSYLKADRMCLTEFDEQKNQWGNLYQWSADKDGEHILSGFDDDTLSRIHDWFINNIVNTEKHCSVSKNDFQDEKLRHVFEQKGIGTLICFPLFHKEGKVGFIGIAFSQPDYMLNEAELNLIDIFSFIVINMWIRDASVKELKNAKQQAEEAVKLKTAFLGNMNHEIRTPMNAVMGFSDLMTEASCEEKNDYAKIVLNSAKQLLKLIDDVIFLSRLQSERLPVTLSECKPAELIDTVFQMFLVSDENVNNLDIRMSYPGNLKDFVIISDVDKIQQVITNFVSNALKYTFSGYVEIGFTVEGNSVRFYVKDTGKGIAKEEIPKIFDAFFRSSDVMFSAIRGTGLGLNIAKELVETMGGKIGVVTELNKGSEFYFTLPYKKVLKQKSTKKIKPPITQQWNELKVLVAEDDEDSYLYMEVLLKKRVKVLDRAVDGLQAIKMAMDNEYDLILMDIKMPEVNGLDATRHIKLKKPHSIIIAQTAYAMPEEKRNALRLGCDDYVTKPVKKEVLYEIIEKKVLGRK